MYTRCPECQTMFRVTVAQLKIRDGLVRCGRCNAVFRADLHLFNAAESSEAESPPDPADDNAEIEPETATQDAEIPTVSELTLFVPPKGRPYIWWWTLGSVVALVVLLGQFLFFYRNELARIPSLTPWLARYCQWLECDIIVTPVLPELLESSIAPHPRYVNLLRVRVTMVNRSDIPQPLPRLQLTLTASDGAVLARRTFTPRDYLDTPALVDHLMESNVVVNAIIDIVNPDGKSSGYEIEIFPPSP